MNRSRYRYSLIAGSDYTLILRDDGYRISFMILEPSADQTPDWELWADYKQCNLPGPAEAIARSLMDEGIQQTRSRDDR